MFVSEYKLVRCNAICKLFYLLQILHATNNGILGAADYIPAHLSCSGVDLLRLEGPEEYQTYG